MSKLEHISKYLNEFKVELENYDVKLTEAAESISSEVKVIQERLEKMEV